MEWKQQKVENKGKITVSLTHSTKSTTTAATTKTTHLLTYLLSRLGQLGSETATRSGLSDSSFSTHKDPLQGLLVDNIHERRLGQIGVVNFKIRHDGSVVAVSCVSGEYCVVKYGSRSQKDGRISIVDSRRPTAPRIRHDTFHVVRCARVMTSCF